MGLISNLLASQAAVEISSPREETELKSTTSNWQPWSNFSVNLSFPCTQTVRTRIKYMEILTFGELKQTNMEFLVTIQLQGILLINIIISLGEEVPLRSHVHKSNGFNGVS